MDLDHARRLVQAAPDSSPFSEVLLKLVAVVERLSADLAQLRQRVEALERQRAPLSVVGRERRSSAISTPLSHTSPDHDAHER
jgi:hypothetical protein